MANRTAWSAGLGVGFTWTNVAYTANAFNSLAAGSGVMNNADITNQTALDLFMDVSFICTANATPSAGDHLDLYMMYLAADGTTYGDGTASGATAPSASLLKQAFQVRLNTAIVCFYEGIVIRPGTFRLGMWSKLTPALAASPAITWQYRTYIFNQNA
jgi:hypothetical protein